MFSIYSKLWAYNYFLICANSAFSLFRIDRFFSSICFLHQPLVGHANYILGLLPREKSLGNIVKSFSIYRIIFSLIFNSETFKVNIPEKIQNEAFPVVRNLLFSLPLSSSTYGVI